MEYVFKILFMVYIPTDHISCMSVNVCVCVGGLVWKNGGNHLIMGLMKEKKRIATFE